jgi:hypothetical protein
MCWARTNPEVSRLRRRRPPNTTPELDVFNEELDELGEIGTEFLPITTRAYHR